MIPASLVLPSWLRVLIASPPEHGQGVHAWLFKVARNLHALLDPEDIVSLLAAASEGCGRQVSEREIRDAVSNSKESQWRPKGTPKSFHKTRRPQWRELNIEVRLKAIATSGIEGFADLWESSPNRCSTDTTDAEFFVDALFPGNPLLCVGVSQWDFRTAPRENFRGQLSRKSFIVPSPMSSLAGRTKDGRISAHTLANTGPRRFLVTEFDSGTTDDQAALIWHLRQFAPTLTLVVSSAGKSLHAWWKCPRDGNETVEKFMRYAVSIGADHATWTRSQFVRLPQGWRPDKQKIQEVAFFDPSPLGEEEL